MKDQDTIVVFQYFQNPIDANIIKTKLDAYDIPCFLTEENFANLYPSNHFITGGIRLHVFSKDEERARTILLEREATMNDTEINCPKCKSLRVEHGLSKKLSNRILNIFSILLFSLLFPQKKVNHCLDCDFEF